MKLDWIKGTSLRYVISSNDIFAHKYTKFVCVPLSLTHVCIKFSLTVF